MQAQARDAAGGNAAPKTRRNAVAAALPAGNVEPPLGATITEHTMITLTVAVAGKPYRKSPEALVELAQRLNGNFGHTPISFPFVRQIVGCVTQGAGNSLNHIHRNLQWL